MINDVMASAHNCRSGSVDCETREVRCLVAQRDGSDHLPQLPRSAALRAPRSPEDQRPPGVSSTNPTPGGGTHVTQLTEVSYLNLGWGIPTIWRMFISQQKRVGNDMIFPFFGWQTSATEIRIADWAALSETHPSERSNRLKQVAYKFCSARIVIQSSILIPGR